MSWAVLLVIGFVCGSLATWRFFAAIQFETDRQAKYKARLNLIEAFLEAGKNPILAIQLSSHSAGRFPNYSAWYLLGTLLSRKKEWGSAALAFAEARKEAGYGVDCKTPMIPDLVSETFEREAVMWCRSSNWEGASRAARGGIFLIESGKIPKCSDGNAIYYKLLIIRLISGVIENRSEVRNWAELLEQMRRGTVPLGGLVEYVDSVSKTSSIEYSTHPWRESADGICKAISETDDLQQVSMLLAAAWKRIDDLEEKEEMKISFLNLQDRLGELIDQLS